MCIRDRQKGGPNHTGNYCDAPILCDVKRNEIKKQLSYTYLGHFSKYLLPGAKRIAFTQYTSQLEVTAFLNPDGVIVAVIMNQTVLDLPIDLDVYKRQKKGWISRKHGDNQHKGIT